MGQTDSTDYDGGQISKDIKTTRLERHVGMAGR